MSNNIDIHSKPIPINTVRSLYGFSAPFKNPNKYYFELYVIFKDNSSKVFRKIDDKKYADLIDLKDEIIFSELKSYNLKVTQIPDNIDKVCTLSGQIFDDKSCHVQNTKDLYIEFSKNDLGLTLCLCHFLGSDITTYGVTPPN